MYSEINSKKYEAGLQASAARIPEPVSTTAVKKELQNLQLQINELNGTLEALFSRMSPVLLAQPPQEAKLSDLPRLCPLAEELRNLGINVGYMIETVHDVHDALQL